MNIVIAGDGEVGFHLAEMLSEDQHSITVVDPRYELLSLIESKTDIMTIAGDPTSPSVLREANVQDADLLISVVHNEHPNILTCILAKKMGAKRTIARVNDIEFLAEGNKQFFKTLGVDEVVCPEHIAATEIVNLLTQTAATEVFSFDHGKLELYLIKLGEDSNVLNKTLTEVSKGYDKMDFRAVAILREGKTIIPKGNDMFLKNDLAYIITQPSGREEMFRISGQKNVNVENVMIVGGGRIGRKTALQIEKEMNVKLLEIDRERCEQILPVFSKTLVINGDATDLDMIEEEGLSEMDAFIAVTNSTETNILTCLNAKKYGVRKAIALVENVDFIKISQNIGIDAIINKKLITASYIARFTIDASVADTRMLNGVDAEVLEFIAQPNSLVTKNAIYALGLPEGAIIGGIIRNDVSYIALGHFRIQEDDRVVVFALPETIKSISKFFK